MEQGAQGIYSLHGLRLRSAVPLTGVAMPDGPYDVDIRWEAGPVVPHGSPPGRVVLALAGRDGDLYVGARGRQGVTLRVPTVGDFVIDGGRRTVTCRLDPATDPSFAAVLIAGLVVATLLNLQGHCVLHASAVEIDGRAIAFAGASGAGKSTLAALLCASGARLVSDDTLRVEVEPQLRCVRGGTGLRLRWGATWVLSQFEATPVCSPTVDGRLGVSPPLGEATVPLAAVVLPRLSRTADSAKVSQVTGAEALLRLAGCARVPGWCDPAVVRDQFGAVAALADRVPVFEAVVPWGPPFRTPIVAALLELVAQAYGCC